MVLMGLTSHEDASPGPRTPKRYIRPGTCARALSAPHASSPATNVLRLIQSPRRRGRGAWARRHRSFNHLVSLSENGWRNLDPKLACGLEVDDHFEVRRVLD